MRFFGLVASSSPQASMLAVAIGADSTPVVSAFRRTGSSAAVAGSAFTRTPASAAGQAASASDPRVALAPAADMSQSDHQAYGS